MDHSVYAYIVVFLEDLSSSSAKLISFNKLNVYYSLL